MRVCISDLLLKVQSSTFGDWITGFYVCRVLFGRAFGRINPLFVKPTLYSIPDTSER